MEQVTSLPPSLQENCGFKAQVICYHLFFYILCFNSFIVWTCILYIQRFSRLAASVHNKFPVL